MKINKYVAELIASFTLTFAVSISIISGTPMATPLVAALVVGIFVYTIGPISGAHISPAVTVGLLSVKKINLRDAAVYIISQIVGAVLAMIVVQGATEGAVDVAAVDSMQSFLAEGLGTFILVFGISMIFISR